MYIYLKSNVKFQKKINISKQLLLNANWAESPAQKVSEGPESTTISQPKVVNNHDQTTDKKVDTTSISENNNAQLESDPIKETQKQKKGKNQLDSQQQGDDTVSLIES